MNDFIKNALFEDVGNGDHTTLACIAENSESTAQLLVKADGIIAGVRWAKSIFNHVDTELKFSENLADGEKVSKGDVVFNIQGNTRSILTAERLVLNVMQRMSGVATTTRAYVEAVSHTKAKILDTRKTTPNMRGLEKEAVKLGGGVNHRIGLFDMILIKDNHIDASGGIANAVMDAIKYLEIRGLNLQIEVEVRSIKELREALAIEGVNRIMLDNFTPDETKNAVEICNKHCPLESSGGINLDTIAQYAETGVDFISVGALTHSVRSLDLSLKVSK